jgi:hypothetical protein
VEKGSGQVKAGKRNVTLSVPEDLIRRAKLQAVLENKSLNQFVCEAVEYRIEQESGYQSARQRHLRLLEKGADLGTCGNVSVPREELHER